jgi:hypothetical protein
MKVGSLILTFLFPFVVYSQAILSVDKTEVRIGDQIKATIKVDLSDGREWINSDVVWPDSTGGIEVVSGPEWNRENPGATLATWNIALFDTGIVRIPSLKLTIRSQQTVDTIYTIDIPIKVLAVQPDSTGLVDIKDIYYQPFNPGYYKRFIPHVALIVAIIVGIILWLRKRKSTYVKPEIRIIPLLPHEWAAKALDGLAEKKLWQHGEVKEHYTLLTDILREYLERRYAIHAKEQTSEEILVQLRQQQLSEVLLTDTEQLLSIADLIKFAKADPGMDIHAMTIERVRRFVRETTESYQSIGEVQIKMESDETAE